MKTAIVLSAAMLSQTIGDVLLSRGMKQTDHLVWARPESWMDSLLKIIALPDVWLGTVFLILFFALFSAALSWADLSFVLPATSFGYVLNVAAAHLFLGEKVTMAKWAGSLLICAGVLAVSRSQVLKKEVATE
jgi:drug/metabolite transporter (DMT)-like permease